MKLIIAEKPSSAKSIAAVLGAKNWRNGCYEGGGYVVSWCVGHLLGLAEPYEYDERYTKWRYEDLPIFPKKWKYTAAEKSKKQLKILTDLIKRPDIETIVNACDAGREGELIFRLVYQHSSSNKPTQRLWVSSLEEQAIVDGFRNLRPGAEYDRLYQVALCRAQADWLVGMNFSRLFTIIYETSSLNIGRVQTPTLAMIVERERKINEFTKELFYVPEITCCHIGKLDGFKASGERLKDKDTAEAIRFACDSQIAVVKTVHNQEKTQSPPKLYDLTTLQREANRLFGYTATQTLNCVQNLYELKIATYPRTDSRFITEDMAKGIPALINNVVTVLPFIGDIGNLNINNIVDNDKVTDHHAIIPTQSITSADISTLSHADKNILTMICTRLISAVSDKYIYAETVASIECGGTMFTAKGKTVIDNGWKAIEKALNESFGKSKKDDDNSLPELFEGQRFTVNASIHEGSTKPPSHFTEDLLLSAMESAGVEDMPDDAERKGLGTPATRAGIIEALINSGMLERKDKLLLPTIKGVNLIKIVPESVKSPRLTAEWENHLKRIERRELSVGDVMISINKFVNDTVKTHNNIPDEHKGLFPSNRHTGERVGTCPRCGGNVNESPKGYFCDTKTCKFAFWKDNKYFTSKKKTLTKEIIKTLLSEGRIFISGLVSEKTGKPYNATIILDDSKEGYPSFKMEF